MCAHRCRRHTTRDLSNKPWQHFVTYDISGERRKKKHHQRSHETHENAVSHIYIYRTICSLLFAPSTRPRCFVNFPSITVVLVRINLLQFSLSFRRPKSERRTSPMWRVTKRTYAYTLRPMCMRECGTRNATETIMCKTTRRRRFVSDPVNADTIAIRRHRLGR